ncbi:MULTISPECIES: hypothetical protein [unclassified Pseudomonas]|jgi:hypothetical protein|uniref:hypothetical protein n=1 Tax=unclassified Pseudomonas TaxID=196821 RepID=UPI0011AFBB00|nr:MULTISPECIES: hypothetical protein [unclassified Pseudomonas]
MNASDVFEDVIVIKEEMNGNQSSVRLAQSQRLLIADSCVRLRPVAWSWFYLGAHVTMDREKAGELIEFGEKLTPLYIVVS